MTQSNESKPVPSSEVPAGTATSTTPTPASTKETADVLIAEGQKATALKQWAEGVAKYADALEIMRGIVGEQDPVMAPILLQYGKALFDLAVSQSGVMGKEEAPKVEEDDDDEGGPSTLIESADPEIMAEAEAAAAAEQGEDVPPEEAPSGEDGAIDEEPEDDYNAAWEVLDVARTIYVKIIEEGEKGTGKGKGKAEEGEDIRRAKLCLADVYQTLGDISCETESFEQAVQDYTSALDLLKPYYTTSSRILASLNFTIGTALEFIPSRRGDALSHVQSALSSFLERQSDLSKPTDQISDPDMAKLSEKEREAEKKEVKELIGDLEVKVEELKSAPEAEGITEGIRQFVGGSEGGAFGGGLEIKKDEGPVNDMSGMVKRKKKPVVAAAENASAGASNVGTKVAETVKGAVGSVREKAEALDETAEMKAVGETLQNAVEIAKEKVETMKEVAQGETVQNAVETAKETAQGAADIAKEKVGLVKEVAQGETVQNALQTAKETAEGVAVTIKEKAEIVKKAMEEKTVEERVEEAKKMALEAVETAKETAGTIREKAVVAADSAMDVVEASIVFTEKVNGGEKRELEGEDGERPSKRAKAE